MKQFLECPMHITTKCARTAIFSLLLVLVSTANAAVIRFQAKSPMGTDVLTITQASQNHADAITITLAHREPSSVCSFELQADAQRLLQKNSSDDFNEALPDGTWVTYANYQTNNETIEELSVDVSSKLPRFAAITLKLPPGYDTKKCLIKNGDLEVLFFK
jgi:hypothetical protein